MLQQPHGEHIGDQPGNQRRSSMDNVVERTERIIRARLHLDPGSPLAREMNAQDLGADSLDGVEILLALEHEFECTIPNAAAERMLTVGDIFDYLAAQPSGSPVVEAALVREAAPSASAAP
jgi:acyl carrier protein